MNTARINVTIFRWVIYAKRESIADSDIERLLQFLDEECEGARVTQKIRNDQQAPTDLYTATASTLHVAANNASSHDPSSKDARRDGPSKNANREAHCIYCDAKGHWAQDCRTIVDVQARRDKLKKDSRCFLCLGKQHNIRTCRRRKKIPYSTCKQFIMPRSAPVYRKVQSHKSSPPRPVIRIFRRLASGSPDPPELVALPDVYLTAAVSAALLPNTWSNHSASKSLPTRSSTFWRSNHLPVPPSPDARSASTSTAIGTPRRPQSAHMKVRTRTSVTQLFQ